jgi:hypothetical protein
VKRSPKPVKKYTVRERVVFEYVYRLRGTSKADIRRQVAEMGDPDIQVEGARNISSVTEGWEKP